MKILVLDGSEDSKFLNIVRRCAPDDDIIPQTNRDISFRSVKRDFYDIIVSFSGKGRMIHEDLVDCLMENNSVHRPLVICIDRNPKVRSFLDVNLRSFKHYVLDVNQENILEEIMKSLKGR